MTELAIIIPVYNSERTLRRTLESLAVIPSASRPNVEIMLVDDASTDGSSSILESWCRSESWGRIAYLRQPENRGSGAARNKALAQVESNWVLMLDADDELLLDPFVSIRGAGDATALLFPVERYRDGRFQRKMQVSLWPASEHLRRFTAGNPLTVSSILFRKSVLHATFVESYRYLEDWVFWINNPGLFDKLRIGSNAPLARIHAHGGNKSRDQRQHGEWRETVARDLRRTLPGLTAHTRNNLNLQETMGRIQAGKPTRLLFVSVLPCTPILYLKYLAYVVLGSRASQDYGCSPG